MVEQRLGVVAVMTLSRACVCVTWCVTLSRDKCCLREMDLLGRMQSVSLGKNWRISVSCGGHISHGRG